MADNNNTLLSPQTAPLTPPNPLGNTAGGSTFVSSDQRMIDAAQNAVKALYALQQAILTAFPQFVGSSSSASGGAATLPANPVGFLELTIPTIGQVKVPYYST